MTAAHRNLHNGIRGFAVLDNEDKEWVLTQLETSLERWAHSNSAEITPLRRTQNQPSHLPPYLLNSVVRALSTEIRRPSVFLSYSSKDKQFVRSLADRLKQQKIRVWLDELEIRVGQPLIEKLREAIDSADFTIVVLSRHSVKSAWVEKEVGIAMMQEMKTGRIKVLPILKEKVALPGFLEGKRYLDFTTRGSRARSFQKLVKDVLTCQAPSIPIIDPFIGK